MGITRAKHVVLFLHGTFYRYGLHHGPCYELGLFLPNPVLWPACEKLHGLFLPDPVICPCEKLLPDPVLREPARSHDSEPARVPAACASDSVHYHSEDRAEGGGEGGEGENDAREAQNVLRCPHCHGSQVDH